MSCRGGVRWCPIWTLVQVDGVQLETIEEIALIGGVILGILHIYD
jgi:hypothetical protein